MKASKESSLVEGDTYLTKELKKLFTRLERIIVPQHAIIENTVGVKLQAVLDDIKSGMYFQDSLPAPDAHEFAMRTIDWDSLEPVILNAIGGDDTSKAIPEDALEEIEIEKKVEADKKDKFFRRYRLARLQERNNQPAMPGKWRKEPFARRTYENLTEYKITSCIEPEEVQELKDLLQTPLNGFVGQAYNFDDHDITEDWMCSFKDGTSTRPSEQDIIRTQTESLLDIMVQQVQERVCTDLGVLDVPPVGLGKDLKEIPAWGIDCYTRKMVELAIEDRVAAEKRTAKSVTYFIQRQLLPSINRIEASKAHDMSYALLAIIEELSTDKSAKITPKAAVYREFAEAVLQSFNELGMDSFRIHPKGSGVVCINPDGIKPHVFICEYLGEMYPAYRWCEKLDVVEQAQKTYDLKPTLPDFYNILLERPRHDPKGYGMLYVDASQSSNMGSICSHSCDPNCFSQVVARNGKLVIALTTTRHVHFGEELTMDYYSFTTSDVEWRAAVCLCGMSGCRGSFLHYATQEDLQQVLHEKYSPLRRYGALLRSCAPTPLSEAEQSVLTRHGFLSAALGVDAPLWLQRVTVENLRFAEYERMSLPAALLRAKNGVSSLYKYSEADMDARSVMEQRIQAIATCISMVQQVLKKNRLPGQTSNIDASLPLSVVPATELITNIWERIIKVADMLKNKVLEPLLVAPIVVPGVKKSTKKSSSTSNARKKKPDEMKSEERKVNKEDEESAFTAGTVDAVVAAVVVPSAEDEATEALAKATEARQKQIEKLHATVATLQMLTETAPTTLPQLRDCSLNIRRELLNVQDLSTPVARIGLLADMIALWSHTYFFSQVKPYRAVESEKIIVVARELGTNIPKSKLYRKLDSGYRVGDPAPYPSLPGTVTSASLKEEADRQVAAAAATSAAVGGIVPEDAAIGTGSETKGKLEPMVLTTVEAAAEAAVSSSSSSSSSTKDSDDQESPFGIAHMPVDSPPTATVSTDSLTSMVDNNASSSSRSSSSNQRMRDRKPKSVSPQTLPEAPKHDNIFDPNEPVFYYPKKYPPNYIFWQLMGWFNSGTDESIGCPELFGSVMLPELEECFGPAESAYGAKQRSALFAHITDSEKSTLPWPTAIKSCFSSGGSSGDSLQESNPLCGSPMLDMVLGRPQSIRLLSEAFGVNLGAQSNANISSANGSGSSSSKSKQKQQQQQKEQENQYDNRAPPEKECEWVQCDNPGCHKWRRVPFHVDMSTLADIWTCDQNTWDIEYASCAMPQEKYDRDEEALVDPMAEGDNNEELQVGQLKDVFCTKNYVYYEASVVKLRDAVQKTKTRKARPRQALFHFKSWSSCFDEWIDVGHYRIKPHNLYTSPDCKDAVAQEEYQGVFLTRKKPKSASKAAAAAAAANKGSKAGKGAKGGKRKATDNICNNVEGSSAGDVDEEVHRPSSKGQGSKQARADVEAREAAERAKKEKALADELRRQQRALERLAGEEGLFEKRQRQDRELQELQAEKEREKSARMLAINASAPKSKQRRTDSWVQCSCCAKWRRYPSNYTPPDSNDWACSMNDWDINIAFCEAPEENLEIYDDVYVDTAVDVTDTTATSVDVSGKDVNVVVKNMESSSFTGGNVANTRYTDSTSREIERSSYSTTYASSDDVEGAVDSYLDDGVGEVKL